MQDATMSATTTTAYALWVLGATLIGLSFFFALQLAAIGLYCAGAGGVLHIRSFFLCDQRQRRARAVDAEVFPFVR